MIRQVLNSLTVHDNSRTFKFDNFSEFKNVISDSLSAPKRHYDALRTKIDICDSPLRTPILKNIFELLLVEVYFLEYCTSF